MSNQKTKLTFKDLKKHFKSNAYYNSPNNAGEEGVDHINISIQSNTRLGKLLDPAYLKTINYRYIGKFNSVMSLWYWVRSPQLDDNYRRLTGHKLKMYAEANNVFANYVPNFKAIIAKATWLKIKSYPNILKEIKELDPKIKFYSYRVVKSSNLRICTNYAVLIIDIADEIVKAVKEDREPNFDLFVDKPHLAGLDYLEGVLLKILPMEKIEEMKKQEVEAEAESEAEAETEAETEVEVEPETEAEVEAETEVNRETVESN